MHIGFGIYTKRKCVLNVEPNHNYAS